MISALFVCFFFNILILLEQLIFFGFELADSGLDFSVLTEVYLGQTSFSDSHITAVQKSMECISFKNFLEIAEIDELRFEKVNAIELSWMEKLLF
mgnify:FL=1